MVESLASGLWCGARVESLSATEAAAVEEESAGPKVKELAVPWCYILSEDWTLGVTYLVIFNWMCVNLYLRTYI